MNMHARVSYRQEARRNPSRVLSFCFLLAGCLVTAPAVAANHHQTFKHLGGAGEAGFTPVGRLLEGSDGALYGTTAYSFAPVDVGGVAFRVNKNGSGYQVLHRFGDAGDGWGLFGGLVEASGGVLYGATYSGGSNGSGTVFRMSRDGSGYGILLHFGANAGEGRNPGELMLASDGVLYGTTRYGGAFTNAAGDGLGTVFKLNQDGSGYSVIHHFGSVPSDGANPVSALVEGSDGRLYGTTEFGGSNSLGTVFRLNTDGSDYAVLRNLGADAADGRMQDGEGVREEVGDLVIAERRPEHGVGRMRQSSGAQGVGMGGHRPIRRDADLRYHQQTGWRRIVGGDRQHGSSASSAGDAQLRQRSEPSGSVGAGQQPGVDASADGGAQADRHRDHRKSPA